MTLLFTGWIKHISLSPLTEMLLLNVANCVFKRLDWGELRVKQLLAAEIKRLEAESHRTCASVQGGVSQLLRKFPEIREL